MEISLSCVKTKAIVDCLKIVAGSLVLALASQISFMLPVTPILVTFQTAALFLIGVTLGPVNAAFSVLLYLCEGLMGLPVFAFGQSGIAILLGPKGGYYLGFCLAAFISGFARKEQRIFQLLLIFIFANAAIYLMGLTWLAPFVGLSNVLTLGFYPFVIGDLLKVGATIALIKASSGLKNSALLTHLTQ